jgi:hypothetical protein
MPQMRGDSHQFLGSEATVINLQGYLSGSTKFDDLVQLDRIRQRGQSLKLSSDLIKTIVYIKSIRPGKLWTSGLDYTLGLEESLFTQLEACNSTAPFSVDSGGGTLSAVTVTPTPVEGLACVKLSGTIAAATASRLKCIPTADLDFSLCSWIKFDFYISSVASLTECIAYFYHAAGDHAYYDFTAMITAAGWTKVMIPKASFFSVGTMEWDKVTYFTVSAKKSIELAYYIALDDVGGYE